jgi:hypothetical protein
VTGHLDVPAGPEFDRLGLGAYALRYQRMGYAVLPLAALAKRPHKLFSDPHNPGQGGVHLATRDPQMVEWAWGQDRLAGIGVATGSASGLVVIDLDVKAGHNGPAELASFMAAWSLTLPQGPWQATPSGGTHLWYRLPPRVSLPGRISILPGVDIKGDGGYVAVAPTHINVDSMDGSRIRLPYRMNGCPCVLPWLPDWVTDWVLHAAGQPDGAGGPGGGDLSDLPDLEQFTEHGLPPGERNITLHRLACRLFRQYGVTPAGLSAVWAMVDQVRANTDMRGFSQHEVSTTIESARRFVARQMEREASRDAEAYAEFQARNKTVSP